MANEPNRGNADRLKLMVPKPLKVLGETCEDSRWLGDIIRSLCGQEVKLDFGQRQALRLCAYELEAASEARRRATERKRLQRRGQTADAAKTKTKTTKTTNNQKPRNGENK